MSILTLYDNLGSIGNLPPPPWRSFYAEHGVQALSEGNHSQVLSIATFDGAIDAIAALIQDGISVTFASTIPAEMGRALFYTPRERRKT